MVLGTGTGLLLSTLGFGLLSLVPCSLHPTYMTAVYMVLKEQRS